MEKTKPIQSQFCADKQLDIVLSLHSNWLLLGYQFTGKAGDVIRENKRWLARLSLIRSAVKAVVCAWRSVLLGASSSPANPTGTAISPLRQTIPNVPAVPYVQLYVRRQ